jgi:nitroimidazol reductase NimA-like FMN-containing flavoprotein (pyridoxamine 5'-phosphate oxidase superfamily)
MSRTTITRLSRKASSDRATLDRLLDTVHIGHFAIARDDGHPTVLPTAVVRDRDHVLAHGSTGSTWLRRLAAGAPTSLAVTAFDGLVVVRSAFESSMRYRSAVLFGQCTTINEANAKRRALDIITDTLIPGRSAEVRASTPKELAAVLVQGPCPSRNGRSRCPPGGRTTHRRTSPVRHGRVCCRWCRATANHSPRGPARRHPTAPLGATPAQPMITPTGHIGPEPIDRYCIGEAEFRSHPAAGHLLPRWGGPDLSRSLVAFAIGVMLPPVGRSSQGAPQRPETDTWPR